MIPKAASAPDNNLLDELQSALSHGTVARRVETLRRVTDLFVNSAIDYSDEQIALFDDVFQCLIQHIEISAKALLANRLAPINAAPYNTIRTLAFDEAIEVAGPVLTQSERLDDDALIQTARSRSQAHLLAISRRRTLSGAVTDVLVMHGNDEVVQNTVNNPGAEFTERGFTRLVNRAEADDDQHHFGALEEDALEGDDEGDPVQAEPALVAGRARGLALFAERLVLVVQRLEARRAQDRLAQPLQAEDQQQGADHELQRRARQPGGERVPGDRRERGERDGGCGHPGERRAPSARQPHGEDDRECLDELDERRGEGRGDEAPGRAHAGVGEVSVRTLRGATATPAVTREPTAAIQRVVEVPIAAAAGPATIKPSGWKASDPNQS